MQTNAQNSNFISTRLFRKYVTLLSKMITMPETVTLNISGTAKEFSVFHRFEFINLGSDDAAKIPQLLVRSYPIGAFVEGEFTADQELIRPEYEFSRNSIFWAGVGNRVFKDYQPMLDKKFGNFSWCYGYERELIHEQFVISNDFLLQEMVVNLSVLEKLDLPEVARVSMGCVDESGVVTPPKPAITKPSTGRKDGMNAISGAGGDNNATSYGAGGDYSPAELAGGHIYSDGMGARGTTPIRPAAGPALLNNTRAARIDETEHLRQLHARLVREDVSALSSREILTTSSGHHPQAGIFQYIKDMLTSMKSPQIS